MKSECILPSLNTCPLLRFISPCLELQLFSLFPQELEQQLQHTVDGHQEQLAALQDSHQQQLQQLRQLQQPDSAAKPAQVTPNRQPLGSSRVGATLLCHDEVS